MNEMNAGTPTNPSDARIDEMLAGIVEPLEWSERRTTAEGNWAWDAKSSIGWYIVSTASGEGCKGTHFWFIAGQTISEWAMSEEEAKAAAEADYRTRILASLNLDPIRSEIRELGEARDEARHEVWNLGLVVGQIAKWPRSHFNRPYLEEWTLRTATLLARWHGSVDRALEVIRVTSGHTKPNKRLEAEAAALTPSHPQDD